MKRRLFVPMSSLTSRDKEKFLTSFRRLGKRKCWLFPVIGPYGYGRFYAYGSNREFKAHRVAYYFAAGKDPKDKEVCHKCDVPSCCNPTHLFRGTQLDNVRDMIGKKRHMYGNRHTNAKAFNRLVERMRLDRSRGCSIKALVAKYKLAHHTVHCILIGKTWKEAGGIIQDVQEQKGQTHSQAKITEKDVRYIRSRSDKERSQLAKRFDISYFTVRQVQLRRTWRHVK